MVYVVGRGLYIKEVLVFLLGFSILYFVSIDAYGGCELSNSDFFMPISDTGTQDFINEICGEQDDYKVNDLPSFVDKDLVYDCSLGATGLRFDGKRVVHVVKGATLKVKNCRFIYDPDYSSRYLFKLIKGSLVLENNEVIIGGGSHYGNGSHAIRKLSKAGPRHWFIKSINDGNKVTFLDNRFLGLNWYASGVLFSNAAGIVEYNIQGNNFSRLHGVLYLGGSTGVVSNNSFFRNSFGNIVSKNVDGLMLEGNALFFPGNGTAGDGFTLSNVVDAKILNNKIISGSCYGLWVRGSVNNLLIKGNVISNGITSAIYLHGNGEKELISIEENFVSGNGGRALAVMGSVEKLKVTGNVFNGNARGGKQVYIRDSSGIGKFHWRGNVDFQDFKKPKDIMDFYSHVIPFAENPLPLALD